MRLYKSPIEQLSANKEKLNQYLERGGYKIKARPFIVLVDGCVEIINGSTGIFITSPERIAQEILNSSNHDFSSEQINGILSALGVH